MTRQPFDPNRDHKIGLEEAERLVQNHVRQAAKGEHLASAFNRSAFERILAQENCAGIRIYRARHEGGGATMVLVGIDKEGNEIAHAQAEFSELANECPPVCDPMGLAYARKGR